MGYGARDKLDREDIIKVSTDEQREELTKYCTEYEEWMYEGVSERNEYENRLSKLKDLLGPMEERALELEARSELPETVKELIEDSRAMQGHIEKNMSWVNENKTAAAAKKLADFEEWWTKKLDQQAALPLHEAPAYTRSDVVERINKVHKELSNLKKTKKPKEKKETKNATADKKGAKKAAKAEEKMPESIEETQKELKEVAAKKAAAVEKEDFDAAHALKQHEKALNEHLGRLQAAKSEL